jgi:hypothetical protein
MDFRDIGCGGMVWINVAVDRDQYWALMNSGNKLSGSVKCWEILKYLSDWLLLKDSAPWS